MELDSGLLKGILDCPQDDAPRLIAADWLEENGDPDRAEFIREQVSGGDLSYSWQYKIDKHQWRGLLGCRWVAEMCLEYNRETDRWPGYSWGSVPSPTGPGLYKCGAREVWMHYKPLVKVTFRRGFVAEIDLPLKLYQQYAGKILSTQPVETVLLTDRKPYYRTAQRN